MKIQVADYTFILQVFFEDRSEGFAVTVLMENDDERPLYTLRCLMLADIPWTANVIYYIDGKRYPRLTKFKEIKHLLMVHPLILNVH